MRLTPLSILLALLLVPGAALAQPPEGEEGEGDAPVGVEEGAEDEAPPAEEEEEVVEEEEVAPEPQVDPEPELSATPAIEGESAEGLGQAEDIEEDLEAYEEEPAADDEEESLPWAASFSWDQSFTTRTLNPSGQLTYNPTYAWGFTLIPSWSFEDYDITVSARQDVEIELTQSDSTVTSREIWFFDTRFDAGWSGLPTFWDISTKLGVRMYLPTSRSSRAAERYLGIGPTASLKRKFDVMEGLTLGTSFVFTHYFAGSNVVTGLRNNRNRFYCPAAGGGDPANCYSGFTTTRDSISAGLSLSFLPIERLTLETSFSWLWSVGHKLAPVTLDDSVIITASDEPVRIGDESDTHMRGSTWFTLAVGYDITDYLNASLTYSSLQPHLDTDGNFENPFWNERSQLVISAALSIDALYENLTTTPATAENDEGEGSETAASEQEVVAW